MFNRSYYDIWVERYGEEEAKRRITEKSKNHSIKMSGENNPMFGKSPEAGAGNGWSGWYKGWYFRSLRELSYVINQIEKNGYSWISAEKKELSIPYIDCCGKNRTYRADFFVNNKTLVEVKPNELMKTPTNCLKFDAAKKFCTEKGFQYVLTDIKIIDPELLLQLCDSRQVIFIEKYKEKLEKKYGNWRNKRIDN